MPGLYRGKGFSKQSNIIVTLTRACLSGRRGSHRALRRHVKNLLAYSTSSGVLTFEQVDRKFLAPSIWQTSVETIKIIALPIFAFTLFVNQSSKTANQLAAYRGFLTPANVALFSETESYNGKQAIDNSTALDFGSKAEVSQKPSKDAARKAREIELISSVINSYRPNHSARELLAEEILSISRDFGVDPFIVTAIISVESSFSENAKSHKGAVGLMQLLPTTAKEISQARTGMKSYPKLTHPSVNIRLGVDYYKQLKKKYAGDRYLALAAYNCGPGNVDQYRNAKTRIPGSVHNYAKKILKRAEVLNRALRSGKQNINFVKAVAISDSEPKNS